MKSKKIISLVGAFGLILATGGAFSASCATETVANDPVVNAAIMSKCYDVICNKFLRSQFPVLMDGPTIIANEALMLEKMEKMSESPSSFERKLATKCKENPKFKANLLKFLSYCETEKHKENYKNFMDIRDKILKHRTPPSTRW